MSLFSGIFNVGIAMGSIIGGWITDEPGVDNIGYIGAAFVIIAAIVTSLYIIPKMGKSESVTSV